MDKNLAKLGDAITNLVYSLAKSEITRTPAGEKVNGRVLTSALHASGLRAKLPARLAFHDRSNAAEALIAYLWLSQKYTLHDLTELLIASLDKNGFSSRAAEERNATKAFTNFFLKISQDLPAANL